MNDLKLLNLNFPNEAHLNNKLLDFFLKICCSIAGAGAAAGTEAGLDVHKRLSNLTLPEKMYLLFEFQTGDAVMKCHGHFFINRTYLIKLITMTALIFFAQEERISVIF